MEMQPPSQAIRVVPREHGAWAMLLQPFLGALVVLQQLSWAVIPSLAAVVLVFLMRDPLVILARQRWVWKVPRPETAVARRYLVVEILLLALVSVGLVLTWPLGAMLKLGSGAAALTGLAVWMTARNKQRSVWLQVASAAGLSSSALAAVIAVVGGVPAWAWWFWLLHAAHFLVAILVVRVRLELRIGARRGTPTADLAEFRRRARVATVLTAAAVPSLAVTHHQAYALALALSAGLHWLELVRMQSPGAAGMAMNTVGLRALSFSLVFTALVIFGSM